MCDSFDINKYLGTWYQLATYPSWFNHAVGYNTTAHYSWECGENTNHIKVCNSTIIRGNKYDSVGTARQVGLASFKVEFPMSEKERLAANREFNYEESIEVQVDYPNYVIDRYWTDTCGEYKFAVVTDPTRQSFYLLSRCPHPSLAQYNQVMDYSIRMFDQSRIVQTPHF